MLPDTAKLNQNFEKKSQKFNKFLKKSSIFLEKLQKIINNGTYRWSWAKIFNSAKVEYF